RPCCPAARASTAPAPRRASRTAPPGSLRSPATAATDRTRITTRALPARARPFQARATRVTTRSSTAANTSPSGRAPGRAPTPTIEDERRRRVSATSPALRPACRRPRVADDLDVVALAIFDEGRVVMRAVVGARPGLAVVLAPCRERGGVERVDLLRVVDAEGVVPAPAGLAVASQPEDLLCSRPHPERIPHVHVDLHSDRAERRAVESARRR